MGNSTAHFLLIEKVIGMGVSTKSDNSVTGSVPHLDPLRERVDDLVSEHSGEGTDEILEAMIKKEFPGRIAVVTSFGAESAVLLKLVSEISKDTPVIFLETQKHFPETLSYRDQLVERLGLTDICSRFPEPVEIARIDPDGTLWNVNPDRCCYLRKVLPLEEALKPFDAWITGRKRFQGDERTELTVFESDETHIKINPLAYWSEEQVKDYLVKHDLPEHPLVDRGYLSIGCAPCTRPVETGQSYRSGRWSGTEKKECGIHKAVWAR